MMEAWAKSTLLNLSKLPQNEAFAGAVSVLLKAYTEAIKQNQNYEHIIANQKEAIEKLTKEVEERNKVIDCLFVHYE